MTVSKYSGQRLPEGTTKLPDGVSDSGVQFFHDGRLVGKLGEPWSTGDVPETKLVVKKNDDQDVDA